MRKFVLATSFGDARRGFVYSRVRDNLFRLATLPVHPKNWRPTTLVLTGNPHSRLTLVTYAIWMGSGRGIVTLVSFLIGGLEENRERRRLIQNELDEFIAENKLQAFPLVVSAPQFDTGLDLLFQSAAVGPLKPNLVLLGFPGKAAGASTFVRHLRAAHSLDISQIVVHDGGLPHLKGRSKKRIDIWWRGKNNGSLMLILAYLIGLNQEWMNTTIRILRLVRDEPARRRAAKEMRTLSERSRIPVAIDIIQSTQPFGEILKEQSDGTNLIFMGFRLPEEGEAERFQQSMSGLLNGLPTTMLVNSTGEADLTS